MTARDIVGSKKETFCLFWASWEQAFTPENINSSFLHTGLHLFNPEEGLQQFTKKEENRPLSSESPSSTLSAKDWHHIQKLFHDAVSDI
jgi:hypothetical protein